MIPKSLLDRALSFAKLARTDMDQDSPEQLLADVVSDFEKMKKRNQKLIEENQDLVARIRRIEDVIWNVK